MLGYLRLNPTLFETFLGNLVFDMPDKNRVVTHTEGTSRLAWSRTKPTRDFREIIRRMQQLARLLPSVFVYQFVKIRNQVF
jgi:hypothetical protein